MALLVEQPAWTVPIGRIDITIDGCKNSRELPGPPHRERDDLLRPFQVCQRCLPFESSCNAVDANRGQRFGGL